MNYFGIKEFNTSNAELKEEIKVKIIENFINPLNPIRIAFGKFIFVRSGYRPELYNKQVGGGKHSQHLFKSKGACDISPTKSGVKPTKADMDLLETVLIESGQFTRIARYKTFFHCDYKGSIRALYNSKWVKIKLI